MLLTSGPKQFHPFQFLLTRSNPVTNQAHAIGNNTREIKREVTQRRP